MDGWMLYERGAERQRGRRTLLLLHRVDACDDGDVVWAVGRRPRSAEEGEGCTQRIYVSLSGTRRLQHLTEDRQDLALARILNVTQANFCQANFDPPRQILG